MAQSPSGRTDTLFLRGVRGAQSLEKGDCGAPAVRVPDLHLAASTRPQKLPGLQVCGHELQDGRAVGSLSLEHLEDLDELLEQLAGLGGAHTGVSGAPARGPPC